MKMAEKKTAKKTAKKKTAQRETPAEGRNRIFLDHCAGIYRSFRQLETIGAVSAAEKMLWAIATVRDAVRAHATRTLTAHHSGREFP